MEKRRTQHDADIRHKSALIRIFDRSEKVASGAWKTVAWEVEWKFDGDNASHSAFYAPDELASALSVTKAIIDRDIAKGLSTLG